MSLFSSKNFKFALILIAALALRLVYLNSSRSSPFYEPALLDPKYYHEWALRIMHGDFGSEVFYGLPLYPFFLGLCYRLFDASLLAVKLAQTGLGVVTVFFIYKIGGKLADEKTGLVAAVFAAVFGPLFFHETILIPEALAVPLYAAGFYLSCVFAEEPTPKKGAALGIVLGLAALTKAGVLPFAILFAALPFFSKKTKNQTLSRVAFIIFFLLTLAPAPLHNFIRAKDTVFLTSHSGFNFYIGNNPRAEGVFVAPEGTGTNVEAQIQDSRMVAERELGRELKPSEVSKYWSDKAWRFIRENPLRFLKLSVKKLILFFDAREISDVDDYQFAKNLNPFLKFPWPDFAWLGPLFFMGLAAGWSRMRHRRLVWLWIGGYLFGIVFFFVNARYRLPLLSVFIPIAAMGLVRVIEWVKAGAWANLSAPAMACAFGVFISQLGLVGTDWARDYVNAGDVYLEKDQTGPAIEFYREALAVNPRHAKANLAMGLAFTKMGRHDEAKDHYLKSIESEPSSQAYNNLGLWLERQGDPAEAERLFLKAIELKPNSSQAYNNLGMLYGKRGEFEKAAETFRHSLKLNPKSPRAHANLGLILYRLGQREEAIAEWEEALRIDPAFEEARKALSYV